MHANFLHWNWRSEFCLLSVFWSDAVFPLAASAVWRSKFVRWRRLRWDCWTNGRKERKTLPSSLRSLSRLTVISRRNEARWPERARSTTLEDFLTADNFYFDSVFFFFFFFFFFLCLLFVDSSSVGSSASTERSLLQSQPNRRGENRRFILRAPLKTLAKNFSHTFSVVSLSIGVAFDWRKKERNAPRVSLGRRSVGKGAVEASLFAP